jgi:hypothetical protein
MLHQPLDGLATDRKHCGGNSFRDKRILFALDAVFHPTFHGD